MRIVPTSMPSKYVLVSIIPILFPVIVALYGLRLRLTNHRRRLAVLRELGLLDIESESKKMVAFFHPYW
jgi:hypothetical protein